MKTSIKYLLASIFLVLLISITTGCHILNKNDTNQNQPDTGTAENKEGTTEKIGDQSDTQTPAKDTEKTSPPESNSEQNKGTGNKEENEQKTIETETKSNNNQGDAIQVVANPEAITVLVNKQYKLPDNYEPKDLVYPNVRFIFSEKIEKRKMRKEAATALEKMFAGAEVEGILLAGASGYRSHSTQVILYNNYVKRDGKEAADRYSARPGHSEHQTGLTMDVSGSTGECAVQDCFGDTAEAAWLAEHAHEYGFIIRYPKDKENITGYKYEPWHIRYVGNEIAKEVYEKDITLEEYYNVAIPVEGHN